MNPGCIPIRLSLGDICAAALMGAAQNVGVFIDALEPGISRRYGTRSKPSCP